MNLTEIELSPEQVAKLIRFCPSSVRHCIRQGQLKATKRSARVYAIAYADLVRFCREHRNAKVRELVLA
jgi:hypothetical protein